METNSSKKYNKNNWGDLRSARLSCQGGWSIASVGSRMSYQRRMCRAEGRRLCIAAWPHDQTFCAEARLLFDSKFNILYAYASFRFQLRLCKYFLFDTFWELLKLRKQERFAGFVVIGTRFALPIPTGTRSEDSFLFFFTMFCYIYLQIYIYLPKELPIFVNVSWFQILQHSRLKFEAQKVCKNKLFIST